MTLFHPENYIYAIAKKENVTTQKTTKVVAGIENRIIKKMKICTKAWWDQDMSSAWYNLHKSHCILDVLLAWNQLLFFLFTVFLLSILSIVNLRLSTSTHMRSFSYPARKVHNIDLQNYNSYRKNYRALIKLVWSSTSLL